MKAVKYYLGIDGGGTKTTAAVADEGGNIICRVAGKTLNFYAVGMAVCRKNLEAILKEIEEKYNISSFSAVFIGCSALDGKANNETISDLCGGIINAERIGMDSDTFVALKAAKGNCIAICGTGSMAMGEKKNGELVIKGGWGHILGDEGSAYSIALTALKRCCAIFDKGERSPLVDEANKHFGTDNLRKIIDVIYSPEMSKDCIASFAVPVCGLAEKGEKVAEEILEKEALSFSKTVVSLVKELDAPPHLSLYGGVFENNCCFKDVFSDELKKCFPEITIEMLSSSAEEGAVKVAMEL